MDLLPIFMNVKNETALVVGGGEVAARKANLLFQSGAKVKLISPEICPSVERMIGENGLQWENKHFSADDLSDCILVIAATDDEQINAQVSSLAKSRGIPVNVVDSPDLCSFIVPSIIDRSPVLVAVSSGGSSPVLARMLRSKLETLIPGSYGSLARLVKSFRDKVKAKFSNTEERRRFWEKVLQGSVAELMFAGREADARAVLEKNVEQGETLVPKVGEVYLVGAGPGDPDLLTFRALRLIQQAEVIVYDRLVSEPIMNLARRDAERIYVGKEKSNHAVPQDQINELLVRLAKEGKRVLRLKGGDPFVFGRGGEEIDRLMEEEISFQVVPGITAATGCAAYAGIPLTHRDYAQSVVFSTGHLRDGTINLDWKSLVQARQTMVFYMGLTGLKIICHQLIEHGMDPHTPLALIEKGTTPEQRVHIGDLSNMEQFDTKNISPPTLIIIGDVVTLRKKLKWFHVESDDLVE